MVFSDTLKALLSPGDTYLFFAVLEGGFKERGLVGEGDLLIIKGKKCYKTALMHFICFGKTMLTASKVY